LRILMTTRTVRLVSYLAPALAAALLFSGCSTEAVDATNPAASTTTKSTTTSTSTSSAPARSATSVGAKLKAVTKATFRDVTIPTGTPLRLSLTSSLGSDTSAIEDEVTAQVTRAILVEGREVVPVGAHVIGHITSVADAGRVKGLGYVAFRFTSLRAWGDQYEVRSEIISREAAATKGEDATKVGIGAGAGAVIGGILGGTKGAAEGAAIGGAGGTGVVLATKGKAIRLGPGDDVSSQLAAPLTIRLETS
jgi:hypothetical protein